MKAKILMLAAMLLLAPTLSFAQTGQAVPLDQAPEMSAMPWLILFTADDWQNDPMSVRVKGELESDPALADVLANSRYNHLTRSHPMFAGYERFHANSLPALLVAAPDPKTDADIWCNVRRDWMPEDAAGLRELIPLDSLDGADGDLKGAPFRWRQPPYLFRPWLWGERPGPSPSPSPAPAPAPAPAPTQRPAVDTGMVAKFNKLQALVEKLIEAKNSPKGMAMQKLMLIALGLASGGGVNALRILRAADDE